MRPYTTTMTPILRRTLRPRTTLSMVVSLGAVMSALSTTTYAQSNIDPDRKFAWTENAGWTNWRDAGSGADGANVSATYLSGYVWAENVGWINLGDGSPVDGVHYANIDDTSFGVNIDSETGDLSGLAWCENIGWINFDTAVLGETRAVFDACIHTFSGYAWSENIGWVNLDDAEHFVAVGPCGFGDYDCDGTVWLDDYAYFLDQVSGPDGETFCPTFDADDDNDVDLLDWSALQQAFTP